MAGARRYDFDAWAKITRPADFSIKRLLQDSGMSRRQLFRECQDSVGMPPRKWFKFKRMELAVEMLPREESIKGTSTALGYKDPANFSRDFKHVHGKCPSAFLASEVRETPVQLWLPFDSKPEVGTHRQLFGTHRQHSPLP